MANPFHSTADSGRVSVVVSGESPNGAFQAFRKKLVVDEIPSPISSFKSHGEHLYVGSKDGNLYQYLLSRNNAYGHARATSARETRAAGLQVISRRIQSKKEVSKIEVVPQFQRLLVLCGGRLTVHDLHSLETSKTSSDNIAKHVKSASQFCVDAQSPPLSRLCIAQKKTLYLFEFTQGEYVYLKEIGVGEAPLDIAWHGAKIFIGTKTKYYIVDANTEHANEVFVPREKGIPPMIHVLPQEHIILSSTEIGVLVDKGGQPVAGVVDLTGKMVMSGAMGGPYFLLLTKPTGSSKQYSLDVHHNGIEQQLVQSIEISEKGTRVFSWETFQGGKHDRGVSNYGRGRDSFRAGSVGGSPPDEASESIFVAVNWPGNRIYRIEPTSYRDQVSSLLAQQNIQQAEHLLNITMGHVEGVEKEEMFLNFHAEACTTLFLHFEFQAVLKHAEKCKMDPREFLHLFPELHPASLPPSKFTPQYITLEKVSMAAKGKDATDIESFASSHFKSAKSLRTLGLTESTSLEQTVESAKLCLADVLLCARSRCSSEVDQRVVDTALFILYASLDSKAEDLRKFANLRIAVKPGDVSDMLQTQQRFNILALMSIESDPRAALEIWMRMGTEEYSDAGGGNGVEETVKCLSETQDEELVWTFASWIMRIDPEKGTQIFCNRHESRSLMIKPDRVIDFFKSFESEGGAGALEWPTVSCRSYLEFVVIETKSEDARLHTHLARSYVEAILALRESGGTALRRHNAGTEPGELGEIRSKCLGYLRNTSLYNVEELLELVTSTELYEERIILLNRIEHHREALRIFVYKTNDVSKAVEYCRKHSPSRVEDPTRARSLFLVLVNLLLSPAREDAASVTRKERYRKMGMELLMKYADEMEPISVLRHLPPSISIASVKPFLTNVAQYIRHRERQDAILCQTAKVENLQVRSELAHLESRGVVLDEYSCCDVCGKPIDIKTVFVVFPNGTVAHNGCCPMGVDFDPLTGEKFEDSAENEFFDYYNNFITPSMKLNDLAPGDDATPKPKRGPNPFSS